MPTPENEDWRNDPTDIRHLTPSPFEDGAEIEPGVFADWVSDETAARLRQIARDRDQTSPSPAQNSQQRGQ